MVNCIVEPMKLLPVPCRLSLHRSRFATPLRLEALMAAAPVVVLGQIHGERLAWQLTTLGEKKGNTEGVRIQPSNKLPSLCWGRGVFATAQQMP